MDSNINLRKFFKWRYYFKGVIAKDDPEKSVLPTIVFINANHKSYEKLRRPGFAIHIGWWHFVLQFGLFSPIKKNKR